MPLLGPYYEQALAIRKEVLERNTPAPAISLNSLDAVASYGDYPAARPYLEQSLAIRKEVLGDKHPDTAVRSIAWDVCCSRCTTIGGPATSGAVIGSARSSGRASPGTHDRFNDLATLAAAIDEWPEAAQDFDQARRVIRRHVSRVLPGLSQREQLNFLQINDQRSGAPR